MPKGNCVFNQAWVENQEYQSWIAEVKDNRHAFLCKLCKKVVDVRSMGESAVQSHGKGKKHQGLEKASKPAVSLTDFLSSQPEVAEQSPSSSGQSATFPTAKGRLSQATIASSVTGSETLEAEVLWTIHAINNHHSFRSSEDNAYLFSRMFRHSSVALNYKCGETKTRYLATFGIAPYFVSLLKKKVKLQTEYVLLFDESLNKELKKKQLDIHIRYWSENEVVTEYLTSEFLGHAYASTICEALEPVLTELGYRQLLQLSMDGPNVNWKVFDDIQADVDKQASVKMLQTGSCGLHVIHNAFRAGCVAANWDIEEFLTRLYILFQDCPARRQDFMEVTGQNKFPLKFCTHRWLENIQPAERTLELLPHLSTYCNAAMTKNVTEPRNASFQIVLKAIQDPLIAAKLHFFLVVAREVQPFLAKYQTNRPMLPFISTDLSDLLTALMDRFIKPDILEKEGSSVEGLVKINIGKDNQVSLEKIKVGYLPRKELLKTKVSDRQRLEFRGNVRDFLQAMIKKILEKSPVTYPLVRHLVVLDPRHLVKKENKEGLVRKMTLILNILNRARRISSDLCEGILSQFNRFLSLVHSSEIRSEFLEFDPENENHRLDVLLFKVIGQDKKLCDLWSVVKQLLILSHGQATVERGFSVNKEAVADNLSEKAMVAKRQIINFVRQAGGIRKVCITKELLLSASSARSKYNDYLESKRDEEEKKRKGEKRKLQEDHISDLKTKKRQLEQEIVDLTAESDILSKEGEKKHQWLLISKSNALRSKATEKESELTSLDKEIEQEAENLKNQ